MYGSLLMEKGDLYAREKTPGPALADMIVNEELDFEQLGKLTLPEARTGRGNSVALCTG